MNVVEMNALTKKVILGDVLAIIHAAASKGAFSVMIDGKLLTYDTINKLAELGFLIDLAVAPKEYAISWHDSEVLEYKANEYKDVIYLVENEYVDD